MTNKNRDAEAAAIGRMIREAGRRTADAQVLKSSLHAYGDSAYLLDLLAFEILLKTVARVSSVPFQRSHSYDRIYAALPPAVRERIARRATERMGGTVDYSSLPQLLEVFSQNFITLRYPYEKYEGLTDVEYQEMGEQWVSGGSPITSATFVYWSEELYGLTHALREELEGMGFESPVVENAT